MRMMVDEIPNIPPLKEETKEEVKTNNTLETLKWIYSIAIQHLSSRRVWSVILSVATILGIHYGSVIVPEICSIVAAGFALDSYVRPKI